MGQQGFQGQAAAVVAKSPVVHLDNISGNNHIDAVKATNQSKKTSRNQELQEQGFEWAERKYV